MSILFRKARGFRRWGDNDKHIGPFTFARDTWKPIVAELCSGHDEYGGCHLRLSAWGFTLITELPAIIKPSRIWVDTSRYEWAKASESKGYWDEHPRVYGFTLNDGHLSVGLGRQTHDSSTEQRWSCFLPWTQWRFVRHSFYGLHGEHVATLPDAGKSYLADLARFDRERAIENSTPSLTFAFKDFDGEALTAKTIIEEREWKLGEGWFKWLWLSDFQG